jgi:hypothetical protein
MKKNESVYGLRHDFSLKEASAPRTPHSIPPPNVYTFSLIACDTPRHCFKPLDALFFLAYLLVETSDTIIKALGLHSTHITNTMTTSQEINNARFSKEALEWDSNEKHVESTSKALEAIKRYVPAFKDGRNKGMSIPCQHVTKTKKVLQSSTF